MNKLSRHKLTGLTAVEEFREITLANHPDVSLRYALLRLGVAGVVSPKHVKEILDNSASDYQRFGGISFVDSENKIQLFSWFAMDEDALLMFSLVYKAHIQAVLTTDEMILQIFFHTGSTEDPIHKYTRELTVGSCEEDAD